ncbi:MAG: hypothetical protein ACP5I1_21235, partial [Candidatus Hinthialibacter sp.]
YGTDPIEVPILQDASQSFDLILGHTVIGDASDVESSRLIDYGTPELFVMLYQDIPLSKKEICKKVFKSGALGKALTTFGIDIYAHLAIAFEARADFQLEFDTTGLDTFRITSNPHDIVNGLYFDDAEGVDNRSITGGAFSFLEDEDQSRIMGGVGLGVTLQLTASIFQLKLGIEGIVFIGEGRDFNDPNSDLKLRAHEFDALLYEDPADMRTHYDNIYNIGIATEFRLDVFAIAKLVFFFGKGLTIFDFRANLLTIQPPNIPLPGTDTSFPELAVISGSDLVLNGHEDSETIFVGYDETADRFVLSNTEYIKTYSAAGIDRITGNVGGGKHFRGSVPYDSATSFSAPQGSTQFDSFLRYSAG